MNCLVATKTRLAVTPVKPDSKIRWWQKFGHRRKWKLTEPLEFELCGHDMVIPVDFEFDFASCPRVFMIFLTDEAVRSAASAVHDYLYKIGYSKRMADAAFRDLMDSEELRRFDSLVMWLAVVIGGWPAYNAHRRAE